MGCPANNGPADWFWDPEALREEYEQHGSLAAAAHAHGVHPSTLNKKWASFARDGVLPPLRRGAKPPNPSVHDGDERLLAALKKLGDRADIEQLSDATGMLPREVRAALKALGHDGYQLEQSDDVVVLHRVPPPSDEVSQILFDGEVYRFAVVSDTHLGSKHERLEELHVAYDMIKAEGIDTVYHPGDLVCGYGVFPHQVNTVHLHTYEEQVEYAALNYPVRDGVTTEIIAGNHDLEGKFGKIGANPVAAVCNRRPDMIFRGRYRHTKELPQGTRIYMLHPQGGSGYAMSYKAQKIAEGFEGGAKPDVALIGHWHKRGDFEWRNIKMLLAGCFEGGGSFGARLGLGEPAVGFHIVEMTVADDGSVVRWKPEWFKFFPGRGIQHAA